ncbi:Hypothetical protein MSYG_3179 [Malassezia sympodialis ATCC 42132]|uniref:Uncharacterized protein n=1 Tax=Malassezia sympodialis (strain ATCC 42132) TaxID=1230383 RepID=A0A1M8A8V3_MALS4|nr:Hypothetical protein MSYG_3179 [Malassezia sympodialis ATCC 42132]
MSQPCQNAFLQQSLGLGAYEGTARPAEQDVAPGPARKPRFGEGRPRPFVAPRAPPQFNPDGTESLEWARYQSAERLRCKWESIYERFKDAHLEDQDEIYLGRAGDDDDRLRIIKDCGSLRKLRRQLKFGSFMSAQEREALSLAEDWDDADDAEASELAEPASADAVAPAPRGPAPNAPAADVNVAVELDIYRAVKRDAIDLLLRTQSLGTAALPYEIPGLQALLHTGSHPQERKELP